MGLANSIPATVLKPGVCTSTTRPANPYAGQYIFETDGGRTRMYDGTGWVIMSEPTQAWTMAVAPLGGTITTLGTTVFNYKRSDGWLTFAGVINITTAGSAAGQYIQFTLPIAPGPASSIGHGRESILNGKTLWVMVQFGSTAFMGNYDNTGPIQSATSLNFTGAYQMNTRYL